MESRDRITTGISMKISEICSITYCIICQETKVVDSMLNIGEISLNQFIERMTMTVWDSLLYGNVDFHHRLFLSTEPFTENLSPQVE